MADMIHHLPDAQGYSDSRGIYSARTAVSQYYDRVVSKTPWSKTSISATVSPS
ncbi:MAG: hypothetical protein R2709_16015 [Marmoricola sp.]